MNLRAPSFVIALAPIFAIGLAGGLNLYATVAMLGLGSRFGLTDPLPPELRGLEDGLIVGAALVFIAIEVVAERIPYVDSIWATIHALVKPIAAALLALALLNPEPTSVRFFVVASTAALALFAHASRGAVSASAEEVRRPWNEVRIHLLHTAGAVGLVLTYQDHPLLALLLSVIILAWIVVLGPRAWRALLLTALAQLGRIRALAGRSQWRLPHELPAELRPLLPERAIAAPQLRAVRAGLKGLHGVGTYRNGWLVLAPDGTSFLFRTLLGPKRIDLPPVRDTIVVPGPWLDAVEIMGADGSRCTLLLMKDGPHPDLAAQHLSSTIP
ncbi:MAG: DUF4126 domain-containing protein [Longimicrobiales bacterium]